MSNRFRNGDRLCETFHFFGIVLLIGGVGLFDLRILGMAKGLPLAAVRRLLPWGVFGFALCVTVPWVLGTDGQLAEIRTRDRKHPAHSLGPGQRAGRSGEPAKGASLMLRSSPPCIRAMASGI